jgi:uncharacterized repeat protein (TIGR03803 family)
MRIVSRGMAIIIAALSLAGSASAAPVETVLYSFTGGSDGTNPLAGPIADNSGALYGTTEIGGTGNNGTVFKLTPPAKGQTAWTETVIYRFCSQPSCSDGVLPQAGSLIADNQGELYGTTAGGGGISHGSYGTVFKLAPPAKGQTVWQETVLYRFCALPNCVDGYGPQAGLLVDDGALYSTTAFGGSANVGTVFKLVPSSGLETVLYSFQGGNDGANPIGGVTALNGALYGTTRFGGSSGNGTVFKLTPPAKGQTAWTETVLYRFTGGSDGRFPYAGLIADKSGALYGTTQQGGSGCPEHNGCGTVFKLTPPAKGQTTWTEAVLYSFKGAPSDGSVPYGGLIADNSGALYSTTGVGGTASLGTVFKLDLCPEPRRSDDHDRCPVSSPRNSGVTASASKSC